MRKVLKINAGIACSDRANEVEPRPNEEHENAKPRKGEMCITDGGAQRNRRYNRGKRAESPNSLAQGNALCNELHPFHSSPERAKSFVNNRLRSERDKGVHFQFLILTCHPYGILLTATIFSTDISSLRDFLTVTTEINAGIACLDRANEVEPRPNEDSVAMWQPKQSGTRRNQSLPKNALIVRDCHVAALLAMTISIVTKILFTQPLKAYVFNPANLVNPINHGSDKSADNISFAAIAMTTSIVTRMLFTQSLSCVSPFSIFNFQLAKAEEAENPQPKSRHKLKLKN